MSRRFVTGFASVMRSASLLAVVVLVVVGAALPIQSAFAASTISLTIAPNPASDDGGATPVTFSGTEIPAKSGATIYIGIFGVPACTGEPGITQSTTELPSGAYSLVLTTGGIGGVGDYSVLAFDPSTNALSSCQSFVITFSGTSGGTFSGAAFAVIGIGAGVAAAGTGLAIAMSGRQRPEVMNFAGYYYCRKHRIPLWYVEGKLWCPLHQRHVRTE